MLLKDYIRPFSDNIELIIKEGHETIYQGYNDNHIPDAHLYVVVYLTIIDEYTLFISVVKAKDLYKDIKIKR